MKRLAEELWTGVPSLNLKLPAALSCYRCNPAERRQAISIFPTVFLRPERTEQSRRKSWAGASKAREEMGFGMLLHRFGDPRIELANRLLELLNLTCKESVRHCGGEY